MNSIQIPTRYGTIHIPSNDEIIGEYLKSYGEWAFLECLFLSQFVEHGRIIDVGAYIGTFSLGMHELCPSASHIDAFELNDDSYRLLQLNTVHASSIKTHCAFVGIPNSNTFFYKNSSNPGGTSIHANTGQHSEVSPIPNNALLKDYIRKDTELIKIDTEGSEASVIASISQSTKDHTSTTIYAEANNSPYTYTIYSAGKRLNLNSYYFMFPSFNSMNYNSSRYELHPLAYEAGILFTDRKPYLSEDLHNRGCRLYNIRTHTDLKEVLWHTPRWGLAEWRNKDHIELIGILSKFYHWETKVNYLQNETPKQS